VTAAPPAVEIGTFAVPFRLVFRHSSAARSATGNVIVRLTDREGATGHGEGCPRSYVTGETAETATAFLTSHGPALVVEVADLEDLHRWVRDNRESIDANPAAFCALELAMLDLLGRRAGLSLERLLDIEPRPLPVPYSAVLGDAGWIAFGAQMVRYRAAGLRHFKLKLSGEPARDRAKFRWFRRPLGRRGESVRVDANNHWTDPEEAIAHLRLLGHHLVGVEEPLRAGDLTGAQHVAEALDTRIILDESMLRARQLADLPGRPRQWIVNIRVSKMGGLIRSIDLLHQAVAAGLGVIVGAQVGETSLLTRAGIALAQAGGDSVLASEGAFGTHLLVDDLTAEPLMFGRRGLVPADRLEDLRRRPGLGLDPVPDRLWLWSVGPTGEASASGQRSSE
jgi:L-alanine-DL-glutamate epimerase-like enolase superfamily enzyme